MRFTSRFRVLSIVVVSVCLAGCDVLSGAPADDPARYHTMRDTNGQLVQFDSLTGDTTPVNAAGAATAPVRPAPVETETEPEPAPVVETEEAEETEAPVVVAVVEDEAPVVDDPEPQPLATTSTPNACSLRHDLGSVDLVVSAPADVFIRAQQLRQPVASLPIDKIVTQVGAEGEWLLVRFDDQPWGRRTGYVHCSNVAIAPSAVS